MSAMQENVPFSSADSTLSEADLAAGAALCNRLSRLALFDNLSGEELKLLLPYLQPMQATTGTTIVAQGNADHLLGIVLDGQATARAPDQEIASNPQQALVPGMCFGEATLIDDHPHPATIIADTDTQLVLLSRENFRKLSASHPIIGVRLLHKICRQLCQQLRQPGGPVMECLG